MPTHKVRPIVVFMASFVSGSCFGCLNATETAMSPMSGAYIDSYVNRLVIFANFEVTKVRPKVDLTLPVVSNYPIAFLDNYGVSLGSEAYS